MAGGQAQALTWGPNTGPVKSTLLHSGNWIPLILPSSKNTGPGIIISRNQSP